MHLNACDDIEISVPIKGLWEGMQMHVSCYGLGVTESGEILSGIFQEHYQDVKHSHTFTYFAKSW